MKTQIKAAAVGAVFAFGLAATAAYAEPSGPAFPGNEALRVVEGKRVVEAPPLTPTAQRYVDRGGSLPPPSAAGEVFMIEGPNGLLECSSPYLSKSACVQTSLGATKRPRFWTVKVSGAWMHCASRVKPFKCEPAAAGVPGGMGTVE